MTTDDTNQTQQAAPRTTPEQQPSPARRESGSTVKVVYRGYSGQFQHGDKVFVQNGDPVEVDRDTFALLQAQFGGVGHVFEEA